MDLRPRLGRGATRSPPARRAILRVNGHDIEPDAEQPTDYGMKCLLYRTSSGLSGEPPEEWLGTAIRRALSAAVFLDTGGELVKCHRPSGCTWGVAGDAGVGHHHPRAVAVVL